MPGKAIPILKSTILHHEKLLEKIKKDKLIHAEKLYIAQLNNRLGNAYRELDQLDLAIKSHERAMSLIPELNRSYFSWQWITI